MNLNFPTVRNENLFGGKDKESEKMNGARTRGRSAI
jgi:hypothetical protein